MSDYVIEIRLKGQKNFYSLTPFIKSERAGQKLLRFWATRGLRRGAGTVRLGRWAAPATSRGPSRFDFYRVIATREV